MHPGKQLQWAAAWESHPASQGSAILIRREVPVEAVAATCSHMTGMAYRGGVVVIEEINP